MIHPENVKKMKSLFLIIVGVILLGCSGLESGEQVKKENLASALEDHSIDLKCTIKGELQGYGKADALFSRSDGKSIATGNITQEGEFLEIKSIQKDGFTYIDGRIMAETIQAFASAFGEGESQGKIETNCDWVKANSAENSINLGEEELQEYSKQGLEVNCVKGKTPDSAFETPGKVCTEKEFSQETSSSTEN